ncbi:MAG: hypothetical protein QM667_11795 [Asticcacaulis sp.]
MGHTLKLAFVAWVLATGGAMAQTPPSPPPSQEGLIFRPPEDFASWNAAGNDSYYTAEFRLKSERQGPASRVLTFQAFRDQTVRQPAAYNAEQLEYRRKFCPDARIEPVSATTENGFPTEISLIVCPKTEKNGQPRYEFVKSVQGATIFLFVDYTLNAEPNAAQRQAVIDYLGTVGLCGKTDGKC